MGGELQYFRAYEGYFFNTLAGHALIAVLNFEGERVGPSDPASGRRKH